MTTKELMDLVQSYCSSEKRLNKLLRVRSFVNNKLNEINYATLLAECYLKVGGNDNHNVSFVGEFHREAVIFIPIFHKKKNLTAGSFFLHL